MPIRLASGLGSQHEADAFVWAAQNGADVISCSWGPEDGDWTNPADPLHAQVVPPPRPSVDPAPAPSGVGAIVLQANTGGGTDNLRATYDQINTPGLAALVGKKPQGTWALIVQDTAAVDTGRIRSISLEMRL